MTQDTATARIVLTTTADMEEGRRLARTLVEEHLVACTTLIPSVESIYRWKGEVETTSEVLLVMKTDQAQLASLEARLHALHSYDTPEFLVLPVQASTEGYLAWMRSSLQSA